MTKISHDLFEASGGLKVAPCKKQIKWQIHLNSVGSGGSYSVQLNRCMAFYVHQDQYTQNIKHLLLAGYLNIEPQGLPSADWGPIVVTRIYEEDSK